MPEYKVKVTQISSGGGAVGALVMFFIIFGADISYCARKQASDNVAKERERQYLTLTHEQCLNQISAAKHQHGDGWRNWWVARFGSEVCATEVSADR